MLFVETGVISKEKEVASSHEMAGEFHWPPALIENPAQQACIFIGDLTKLCRLQEW